MRLAVNTPAGHVGRAVVERLLAAGEDVVITSRHPSKVADFVSRGARLVEGSIDEPHVLATALEHVDALLWVTPPAYERVDFVDWVAKTARTAATIAGEHGIRRAVVISSAGAQAGSGGGPIGALLAVEMAFQSVLPDVTVLRCGPFMENFLYNVDTIARAGAIFAPLPASGSDPYVATRDIGEHAAEVLRDRRWSGHRIRGLHGPENLSPTRAVEVIGELLGREVRYVEVSIEQARQSMIGLGMPVHAIELLVEMYSAIHTGKTYLAEQRSAETTGRTTFHEFARDVLVPAIGTVARGN